MQKFVKRNLDSPSFLELPAFTFHERGEASPKRGQSTFCRSAHQFHLAAARFGSGLAGQYRGHFFSGFFAKNRESILRAPWQGLERWAKGSKDTPYFLAKTPYF